MWRRTYLLLLLIRLYFALCPTYLHPDEIFQGPEIVAGEIFGFRSVHTWEWTVANPIRSVFPLWPVYGLPMTLLKTLWSQETDGFVSPTIIYYTTRIVMFIMCFVLEDWAIHELVHSPRRRKDAVTLVASSYVTWTFQTHTFSNSVETLVVLWCLVLMQRIIDTTRGQQEGKSELVRDAVPRRLCLTSGLILGYLVVFGVFNRITFPAFLLIPGMQLIPYLLNKPVALFAVILSALTTGFIAIATDTTFYTGPAATTSFRALFKHIHESPVITPINNLLYNSKASNLKQHGLHPHYQHLLVNLPQLLGPALLVLIPTHLRTSNFSIEGMLRNTRLTAAITGCLILSGIPHQEPRFLLPCVPLILTCVHVPESPIWRKRFWICWGTFNGLMGVLMGMYHQGGIIPAQLNMPETIRTSIMNTHSTTGNVDIYWWKTYPPSLSMLGPELYNPLTNEVVELTTTPLLGANKTTLISSVTSNLGPCEAQRNLLSKFASALSLSENAHQVLLVAPFAGWRFDSSRSIPSISNFTFSLPMPSEYGDEASLRLTHLETYKKHINLDDMDFGDDGILPTLGRVIGRRGLGVWRVERECTLHEDNGQSGVISE